MLQSLRQYKWKLINPLAGGLPWFDRPDAERELERRAARHGLDARDREALRHWIRDGYFILEGAIDAARIDAMNRDLDGLWEAAEATPGLWINDARLTANAAPRRAEHAELLRLLPEERRRIRDRDRWRVHQFHSFSPAARAIFEDAGLRRHVEILFGRPCPPDHSINFMYGSDQFLHQDMAVFHIIPRNYLVGVWIACEDIQPDSGPLVLYPGTHREPMFAKFSNYPQTNLRTADAATSAEYKAWMRRACEEKYKPFHFLGKKGDAIFWHGMVAHGGSAIANPARTRRSFVIHYIPPGMNRALQVRGPFNW